MTKTFIDLESLSEAAARPGFSLLYSPNKTIFGCSPTKTLKRIPEKKDFNKKRQSFIGYLAYPNPKLKNKIPSLQFYDYPFLETFDEASFKKSKTTYKTTGQLEISVTKREYFKVIAKIKELLAIGEVYQINYAIRFRKQIFGDPYALFLRLAGNQPADFSAYLNCGRYQIISQSPERLFKVENGVIITQPIKGTVSKQGGKRTFEAFLTDEKERAELDMITDLERNDIGKVCKYGTLELTKEREIMELPNLYHTYSEVQGKLPRSVTNKEVFRAMFPGGSITGCPKKRAMEYIERLEKLPRNIFTGSIAYINKNSIDTSICIRTALVQNGFVEYWAGGGIVADSDSEKEYSECLLKAEKFLSIL